MMVKRLKPISAQLMQENAKDQVEASLMSLDRKSTRLNSSHSRASRMPSSA